MTTAMFTFFAVPPVHIRFALNKVYRSQRPPELIGAVNVLLAPPMLSFSYILTEGTKSFAISVVPRSQRSTVVPRSQRIPEINVFLFESDGTNKACESRLSSICAACLAGAFPQHALHCFSIINS